MIMECLEVRDLWQIMRTCRTMYELGGPVFLRTVDLTRHPDNPYRGYLSGNLQRVSCIWSLKCDSRELRMDSDLVTALKTRCLGLRSLVLHKASYLVSPLGSTVIDWIVSLPELKNIAIHMHTVLHINAPIWHPETLFSRLNTPLSTITLCRDQWPSGSQVQVPIRDEPWLSDRVVIYPILIVRNFALSLRELSVTWPNASVIVPREMEERLVAFPQMKKLTWRSQEFIDVDVLVEIFPNLQDLSVGYIGF